MSSHNPPRPRCSPVRPSWLGGVFVLMVSAALLIPVVHHDFVAWDDDLHVTTNPSFQPVNREHIMGFWQEPYARLYIPLTYTVWGLLVWVSQATASGPLSAELFHRLNLLLHLGSVLVVYRLALLVFNRCLSIVSNGMVGAAMVTALIFGLHPLQIESVAWVSGLKDVLYGWWALVAVWLYLEYTQSPHMWQRVFRYCLACVAFALALFAKPSAVAVPAVAMLLATRGIGQPLGRTIRNLGIWFVTAGLWVVLTKGQQPDTVMEYVTPLWGRIVVAGDAVAFYLGKFVWPFALGPDYGRTPQMVLGHAWGYLTGLLPLGLALLLWRWRERWHGLNLAAGLFITGLLPILGFIPFVFQGHSTVADRYAYLALLGPALGIGWLIQRHAHRKLVWLCSLLLIGMLAWRSWQQMQVWQNTITLFTHALKVNPQSAISHGKLGTAMAQIGQYNEAIAHYQAALRLRPNYVSAHNNLGHVRFKQGQIDQALSHYRTALKIEPDRAEVHLNLGLALAEQGKLDEAIRHYSEALNSHRDRVLAHTSIGRALAAQGKLTEAIAHYTKALALKPDAVEAHYNLGNALVRQGRQDSAIVHYTEALRLNPELAEVHNNLGSALDEQGRTPEAIPHYQAAIRLKPDFAEAHNNLGDALLDLGYIPQAAEQFAVAVHLQPGWVEAHYNHGIALSALGRHQDAIAAYRQALQLRPAWPPAALKLAWSLATQSKPSEQNANEAVALAEQANRAQKTPDAMALYTLALAYRAAGQGRAALQTAQRAMVTATAMGTTAIMAEIERQFPRLAQKEPVHVLP